MLLHAVGVDASFFDAIAVLIAVVTLSQLPIGPSVGAAAAVLILGSDGVAAAAAAGVLMTVTGTFGGLCFAAWPARDGLCATIARASAIRRTSHAAALTAVLASAAASCAGSAAGCVRLLGLRPSERTHPLYLGPLLAVFRAAQRPGDVTAPPALARAAARRRASPASAGR